MSIADKLQSLLAIKNEIKTAIRAKGVTLEDNTPFTDYVTKINAIVGGDDVGESLPSILEFEINGGVLSSKNKINVPIGVTEIDDNCFKDLKHIVELSLPEGLLKIGASAFSSCSSITEFNLPSSLKEIGASAFQASVGFKTITLGENITKIERLTFSYCTGLESVICLGDIVSIGNSAFAGTGLKVANFPKLKSIGESVFHYCNSLESIDLGDEILETPSYLIADCSNLTTFKYPSSVEIINNGSLNNLGALKKVELGENVKTIITPMIEYCYVLEDVIVRAVNPPQITGDWGGVFEYCYALSSIYVPDDSVDAYKIAAGWSIYESKIKPLSQMP